MVKTLGMAAAAAAGLALGGCASVRQVDSDVSSYSQWPTARPATTYAFERLPSQQSRPERQQALEDAARPAIEAAGFRPAASPGSADVNVQVTANVTPALYPEPFGWGGGFGLGYGRGHGRHAFNTGFGMNYYGSLRYEREVALLIRDRSNGAALYETRARSEGLTASVDDYLPAMFLAALKDFPSGGVNPRRISVDLPVVR
ncbi:MAG: DUF4136 domain-containing protein [Burkholderiaceae bacterium]